MENFSEDELMHYGTPRHSGRYPWGSGDNPYQHEYDFKSKYDELRDKGLTEVEIAEAFHLKTTDLRRELSISSKRIYADNVNRASALKAKGYTTTKVAEIMGVNESTVRGWISEKAQQTAKEVNKYSDMLKDVLKEKGGYLDVSAGVEREIGISQDKLQTAVRQCKNDGYEVYNMKIPQINNLHKNTTTMVLCPPGTQWKEVRFGLENIKTISDYASADGEDIKLVQYPKSIDGKRVKVKLAEEGGSDKDGVIEIRRGVPDLDLNGSNYAQVRIAVDGKTYLKGMAMYSDDIPDGYDIVFNSSKHSVEKALKPIKNDELLPFGAKISPNGQHYYIDENGNKQLSLINKVNDEGDWERWSKTLSTQFLSKQPLSLIKKQLDLSLADKEEEFAALNELTNPVVKQNLLMKFADECDGAAIDLKAASLPRQQSHVILPLNDISEKEIFAPNYKNGETVVLIRYPHAGIFEIPELVVNNKIESGKRNIGLNSQDAVGINPKVAAQLSGADFDGDTVMVIPTNQNVRIQTAKPREELVRFTETFHDKYAGYPGMDKMTETQKQSEMGKISNLITDMTLKGAPIDDVVKAVKHSMVVIDAVKHNLDYKKSYEENGIAELKTLYQGGPTAGASTLISRASSKAVVNERRGSGRIDPKTGEVYYFESGRTYTPWDKNTKQYVTDKNGNPVVKKATQDSTKMAETKDAYTLSSGHIKENTYAEYANKMKSMANQARLAAIHVDKFDVSKSAQEAYAKEVASLKVKLNEALLNAPRERAAQIMANVKLSAYKKDNPQATKDEIKRYGDTALSEARHAVGASKKQSAVRITPREWEAIQAHAVTATTLRSILNNADSDTVRDYATPKAKRELSVTQINLIKSMKNSGYTNDDIAERLGYSTSTIHKYLGGEK